MLGTKINLRIRSPWEIIPLMNPQYQSLSHKHISPLQRLSMMLHVFLDNGATRHVTSTIDSMNTNFKYLGIGRLALGDDSQLPITHIGHITLPTSRSLQLKNVLMVPSITKNLISISKFTIENNVIVEFDSTCCYIKDK